MGRVSPLLDVAERFLLCEVQQGREIWRREVFIAECGVGERTRRLLSMEASVLICGGVSRQLEYMLVSSGMRLIPQTCGPVQEVMDAYLAGQLTQETFLMPGRGRRRHRHRGGRGTGRFGTEGR